MNDQEYFMKLQALEYEANHLGEQLKIIEQQQGEMQIIKESVSQLEISDKGEIFSELGKGIYVKASLSKSDLLVDVGEKVLVPKSHKEVMLIVEDQIGKFETVKEQIAKRIEDINTELNSIIESSKKSNKEANKKKTSKKD